MDRASSSDSEYLGDELEIFEHAVNWKRYFAAVIGPYIRGPVLEVGAGLGGTTAVLAPLFPDEWTCLEPDPRLAGQIEMKIRQGALPKSCFVLNGSLTSLKEAARFGTILYIDVLEHIERDREEIARACSFLSPEGTLIVLSPAFSLLYSPFDKAIGHFRRYTKATLEALTPAGATFERGLYLDSVGMLLSLANRALLKQHGPTLKQILFWDRTVIKISRVIDPLLFHAIGRSVVGIWRRNKA